MRTVEQTAAFRRDYKRTKSNPLHKDIADILPELVDMLVNDRALPAKYRDHPLIGPWKGHRDCHIKPDLVLIYARVGDSALRLVRLGSHSDLFLKRNQSKRRVAESSDVGFFLMKKPP